MKQQIEELKADAQADKQFGEEKIKSSSRKMARAAELEKLCETLEFEGLPPKEVTLRRLSKRTEK
ncbi:MAG: hypothetical protein ACLQHM_04630 [Limisphaerales bacterium]